jgi:hypothetical protein
MDCIYPPLSVIDGYVTFESTNTIFDINDISLTQEGKITDDSELLNVKVSCELYSKRFKSCNSTTTYECVLTIEHPITHVKTSTVHFVGYYFEKNSSFKLVNSLMINLPIFSSLKFPKIENLHICSGSLTDIPFKNIPSSVKNLIVENNMLENITYIPEHIKYLDVSNNSLTYINLTGSKLENLTINHNKLTHLNNLPDTLKELRCSHNYFDKLPDVSYLPNLLLYECSNNKVPLKNIIIKGNIDKLILNFNELTGITFEEKSNVCYLEIVGNKISNLTMTEKMKVLYCSANKNISIIPNDCVTKLHISGCNLTELPKLPKTLIELRACGNLINNVTTLPTPDKNLIVYLYDNPIEKVYAEYYTFLTKNQK